MKACHASGKTFLAGGLVLWWLQRWPRGKVITTAPTLRQVKLMWEEIELARQASAIRFPECTTTGLRISEDRYAIGMSSARGVNVQGFHGERVLIIADEAPGIDQDIWDAIEGIRAGGDVTLLELGNPTIASGHFYENFARGRSTCECITISAFDSPNLAGLNEQSLMELSEEQLDEASLRYLVSRRWVKERLLRWGRTHPMYAARVLGEFPTQADDAVYSLEWIEHAARPTEQPVIDALIARGEHIRVGIDVAGPGEDETAICARIGGAIVLQKAWSMPDPRGVLLRELNNLRANRWRAPMGPVMIDAVGIGYHVATHLADAHFDVRAFNAGGASVRSDLFANAKAEAYWSLREWLERRAVWGLTDDETQAQLAGIRYEHSASGRVEIESKDDARKRGVSSPDRAEAVVMAFVPAVPRQQNIDLTPEYEISPV